MDYEKEPAPPGNLVSARKSGLQEHDVPSSKSEKIDRILAACGALENLEPLIALATSSNGLINDEIRRVACMSQEHLSISPG